MLTAPYTTAHISTSRVAYVRSVRAHSTTPPVHYLDLYAYNMIIFHIVVFVRLLKGLFILHMREIALCAGRDDSVLRGLD